jgi:hypothetical protein
MKDGDVEGAIGKVSGSNAQIQPERVEGQANTLDTELLSILHQEIKNHRVQVQVQVAVDVVEFESRSPESLKLGMHFATQLLAQTALKEISKTSAGGIVRKLPVGIDQARYFGCWQGGMTAEEGQVQPDAEAGVLPCQVDSLGTGGFVYHEAGGGQDAFSMSADDGPVNGGRSPKIVGVDDETALWTRGCHLF